MPRSLGSPREGPSRSCSPPRIRSALSALILQGAEVRERTDDEWPWGEATAEEHEASMATLAEPLGPGHGNLADRAVA